MKLTEVAGNAVLDVYESCQEVTGAFNQYQQRGRQCRAEYVASIRKLAQTFRSATAKGVPQELAIKVIIDYLPTKALKLFENE